ncbi:MULTISPECIES: tetratricopeptide repeat protein [Paenibacillus]|uniref:tetratricopeptide repeat protein n=1 Tax=Paenibacillus TaxID=44249 RepID=UPI002FE0A2A7
MMFQHMFAEMNEMLDEVIQFYPIAHGTQKQDLAKKWHLLQQMSDGIIEEWLSFEEKMGLLRQSSAGPQGDFAAKLPEMDCDAFVKGQGYYKLMMFPQALTHFKQALEQFPESPSARTYLAMCHLHMEETDEAIPHFWRVLEGTENKRLRSIIYNALGCIEAQRGGRAKAKEYFTLAHYHDPSLAEPLSNLEACMRSTGKLKYGNELTSLL